MKGTRYLETLGQATVMSFDKSGTLTQGRFRLVALDPLTKGGSGTCTEVLDPLTEGGSSTKDPCSSLRLTEGDCRLHGSSMCSSSGSSNAWGVEACGCSTEDMCRGALGGSDGIVVGSSDAVHSACDAYSTFSVGEIGSSVRAARGCSVHLMSFLINAAAALEVHSSHPIAAAITSYATAQPSYCK